MKILANFGIIQPEEHDKNMVPGLDLFYRFGEIDILLDRLESERAVEAEAYLVAQELGNTAMMAYRQDVISQIHTAIQEVAGVAAEQLHTELGRFMNQPK